MIEGVFYNFASGMTMQPRSYAPIVAIDPGTFRQKYNVPASTQIFGPWNGELLNTGERVALGRAAEPQAYVPYAIADEVFYNAGPGWPQAANGQSALLNRRDPIEFGNDILNWQASAPAELRVEQTLTQCRPTCAEPCTAT